MLSLNYLVNDENSFNAKLQNRLNLKVHIYYPVQKGKRTTFEFENA